MTKDVLKMRSIEPSPSHGAPPGFPFCFFCHLYNDNVREFDEMLEWCRARHGKDGIHANWYERYGAIFIRHPEHAMEFKIRWG